MHLEHRYRVSILCSAAISVLLAALALQSLRGTEAELSRGRYFDTVIKEAYDLSTLVATARDKTLRRNGRQIQIVQATLAKLLRDLPVAAPREELLLSRIRANVRELSPLLQHYITPRPHLDSNLDLEAGTILASQILVKTSFVTDDTNRLMQISRNNIISDQNRTAALIVALMCAMILITSAISVRFGRRVWAARELLLKNEERFRFAREAANVGVWDWNPATRKLHWTPEFEKLFGLEPGSVRDYRGFVSRVHPDDIPMVEAKRDGAIERQEPFKFEYRLLRPSGEIRWVHCCGGALHDRHGKPPRIFGVNIDITELRQTQMELHEAKEQAERRAGEMEALMDAVPAMIWIARDTHCFSMTGNRTLYEFLGMPTGANISKTAPEAQRPGHFKALHNGAEIPLRELPMQKAARGTGMRDYELEYLFEDGTARVTLGNTTPLYDTTGQVYGAIAAFVDITERKRAEEALRSSEERLALATATTGIGIFDEDSLTGNIACTEQFGYLVGLRATPTEAATALSHHYTVEQWAERVHPDDRPRLRTLIEASRSERRPLDAQYRVNPPDGRKRWLNVRGTFHDDTHGNPTRFLGVLIDVTGQKQLQQNLENLTDQLELRVHERTAELEATTQRLRAITAKLIEVQENERKRLASDLHDTVGQTLAALKFRMELIADKLQAGLSEEAMRLITEFVPVMQRSIEETRTLYMGLRPALLADHGISATLDWYRRQLMMIYPRIHIELETGVREEVISPDLKTAIFRIAQEALNNSCKHSNAEWVDVRLVENKDGVRLEISDDGIGMDLDSIIASSATRSLGLLEMRERTQLTGGEFTINSAPHAGATITAVWDGANLLRPTPISC
jgi:PAS domain S-box-containing protein